MVWCGRGQEFFQAIFARRLCGEAKVIEWLLSQKRQAAKPKAPKGGGKSPDEAEKEGKAGQSPDGGKKATDTVAPQVTRKIKALFRSARAQGPRAWSLGARTRE